jgi:DNA-binding GntR family transcriptional regulator
MGAVVRELDVAELAELYDIRKSLEPLSIRRAAARITPGELARAQALADAMENESDPAAWAGLNRQFHASLEDVAHAPFIRSVLKGVQDIAAAYLAHSLILRPRLISTGNEQHRGLLAALRRGDPDAAAALLVAHLDCALRAILDSQTKHTPAAARQR